MLVEPDFENGLAHEPCICIGRWPGEETNDWGVWQAEINEMGQIISMISILQTPQEKESEILAKLIADRLSQPLYRILPNNDLELVQLPNSDQT